MAAQYKCVEYFQKNEDIVAGFFVQHREMHLHTHEFWELAYVYEGRGTHYLDCGRQQEIHEGEIVLMSPGAVHCITSPPAGKGEWVRMCNILMRENYVSGIISRFLALEEFKDGAFSKLLKRDSPVFIQIKDYMEGARNLFQAAVYEYRHKMGGSEIILNDAVFHLFLHMARIYEKQLTGELFEEKADAVWDVTKYIETNFGKNITLDYLAAYVHLAPAYLSRLFKKSTGKTISDFLTQTRMEHAKQMLRTTDNTVGHIGNDCGYRTLSNFQRAFKNATGMPPAEYREKNRA